MRTLACAHLATRHVRGMGICAWHGMYAWYVCVVQERRESQAAHLHHGFPRRGRSHIRLCVHVFRECAVLSLC